MSDKALALRIAKELERREAQTKIKKFDPYPRQKEYLSSKTKVTALIAANRVGKSRGMAAGVTYHITGQYPAWWTGRRFVEATNWWVIGVTTESTRDILQKELLGDIGAPEGSPNGLGTGLIPRDCIISVSKKQGVPNAVDTVYVKHVSGGIGAIQFKSAEQGREKMQGVALTGGAWLDEEVPYDIYSEVLTRLTTTSGQLWLTFTPLNGFTDLIKKIQEDAEKLPNFISVYSMTWDDAKHPDGRSHLSPEVLEQLEAAMLPHEREARKYGRPSAGSGVVFPFAQADITCRPFLPEKFWPRLIGLDPGYSGATAAVLAAHDPESDTIYIIAEYLRSREAVPIHASAIRRWGVIPIVYDHAANQAQQGTGETVADMYRDEFGYTAERERWDLMIKANKDWDAGYAKLYQMFSEGRLVIFDTCHELLKELRNYVWAEPKPGVKQKPVKKDDHLIDAMRYLVMGIDKAKPAGGLENKNFQIKQWKPATRGY